MADYPDPRKRRFGLVSPVTLSPLSLVNALLVLSQEIARCPKPRFCQRKNAAVITRRVKVLSLLFEVIRDSSQPLPPSAVLCFTELYIMMQRTKILLEDWGQKSRLWILMQSEVISSQFQELNQEMATALDVLPLRLLDIMEDVREQVELVRSQARRSKNCADKIEQQLRKDVLAVLDEFESQVSPDTAILVKIFDHIGLKDAKECREEIQLLEDEIREQSPLAGNEQNISLLNSLISLIRYSKCVLFGVAEVDDLKDEKAEKLENPCGDDIPAVPDDFRCPISLDLMRDPVIVSTGQTYDRTSITRWIEEGHQTCPKSGQVLVHTNLIPNHALRNLIQRWCEAHGVPFEKPERKNQNISLESVASTKAALEATKMTAAFLVEKLCSGTADVKKQVAYELRLLAKCGMDNRACIAEAGAIPHLVPLLHSDDPKTQENAVTALLNLSIFESNKVLIAEAPGCLDSIIEVLKSGRSIEAKENAAATLFSLSSVNEYKKVIGEKPDAIPALVELLRSGTTRGKRDAVSALFNLSFFRGNETRVVESGALPMLVNLLLDDDADRERPGLADDALAVLALLARQKQGLQAMSKSSVIVPALVGLLRSASPKGKENSIAILLSLCRNGDASIINAVTRTPFLERALYGLLTSGTPRAKRKATSFLRVLQRFEPPRHANAEDSAAFMSVTSTAVAATAPPVR
eukprot:TRINITY_DN17551_c0_g1_i1.p1 TRINITY_DN17551_c0_g1~~TRINITY_DN17551_c0_g1_i1.p1  ORF type:complete len:695 (+),score=39.47 TRINITY_DN17551_c0_g1_i1:84-2168(+)